MINQRKKINNYYFSAKSIVKVKHDEYKFEYKGKFLTEKEFRGELIEEIENNIYRYSGSNGYQMIKFYENIPTFDSEDRMYDSFQCIYVWKENEVLMGYCIRGGYRLADVSKLTKLYSNDQRTNEVLKKYGMIAENTGKTSSLLKELWKNICRKR